MEAICIVCMSPSLPSHSRVSLPSANAGRSLTLALPEGPRPQQQLALPPLSFPTPSTPSRGSFVTRHWLSVPHVSLGSGMVGRRATLCSTHLFSRSGTRNTPGNRSSSSGAACPVQMPSSPLAVASAPRLSPSWISSSQLFYAITP